MEFQNRLYDLRKKRGISQEELAGEVGVSRQTISKWETGESTPDMEKMIALSTYFGITLDELVLGKKDMPENMTENMTDNTVGKTVEKVMDISEKIFTPENKKKVRKGLKIAGIAAAVILAVDIISMVIYFVLYGVPK